ncbi:MAG: hypothetical protein ACTHQ3_12795 [Motilibacteraceae bacterium]
MRTRVLDVDDPVLADLNPASGGVLVIYPPEPAGLPVTVALTPWAAGDSHARHQVACAALQRLTRFLEHGPDPDGLQARTDGGWQTWLVHRPELEHLDLEAAVGG